MYVKFLTCNIRGFQKEDKRTSATKAMFFIRIYYLIPLDIVGNN